MSRTNSAHEADSDTTRPKYPGLLQEVFQWKPKPRGKKQKSQIDETRTEISYSASTGLGDDYETSTYVSKDFGTPSSRSVDSRKSKKRSKKSFKDASGSLHSEPVPSSNVSEPPKDIAVEPSYFVTLNCPLCYDPDCILNKAAQCPLLRHKDPPCTLIQPQDIANEYAAEPGVPKDAKCNECIDAPKEAKCNQCSTEPDSPKEINCNDCKTAPKDDKCNECTTAAKDDECTVIPDVADNCCAFCGTNCRCEENKRKFLPVSGLVQRDENGVAVTLLKANGGPIENSYGWVNRRRWDVPSHVRWEYKINEWISVPLREHEKAGDGEHRKKSHKSRNKRKSRITDKNVAATTEADPNVEESKPEEEEETKLIIDGNGFKIFAKGNEKILINYDKKNCKYMGCNCLATVDSANCGCGGQQGTKEKIKHKKRCPKGLQKIALLKETSHGLEPVSKKEVDERLNHEKKNSGDSTSKIMSPEGSSQKLKKADSDKKEDQQATENGVKVGLIGKDIRDMSRVDFLEKSLREMMGDDYRGSANESVGQEIQPDNYVGIICPSWEQPRGTSFGGNFGGCTCAQGCCDSPCQ